MKEIIISKQFPALSTSEIADIESALSTRFGYHKIPDDYKKFLQHTNGCLFHFADNDEDEDEDEDECDYVIDVNLPFTTTSPVAGLFGIWLDKYRHDKNINSHWPELFASNKNSKENFDVLPNEMMSFAYEMESSGGLYAMSVAEKDFGKVYFYYDEYYYSVRVRKYMLEKHGYCYYDQKIKTILEKYSIDLNKITAIQLGHRLIPGVIIDEVDNLPPECIFELERANFIPIADSFTDFINKLFVEKI